MRSTDREESIPKDIFKAYDIRGKTDSSFSKELMREIGLAFGTLMQIQSCDQVCVGSDGRFTSPSYKSSLIEGLTATGVNVIDIGMVPTPVVYFATHFLNSGTGISVTASHNPPEYNGAKMVLAGHSVYGENIQKIRRRIVFQHYVDGHGSVREQSVLENYIETIVNDIEIERPLHVVLDCANGVGGVVAPQVLRSLGCKVTELYCDVDGSFPNHGADPTRPENLNDLIKTVQKSKADLGLALDGDADRMVAVSPDGQIIWPDRLMILFSREILKHQPNSKIVFDVKCTRALKSEIEKSGGEPIMWKTGHSLMKTKLAECGAAFGGEMSGHFFFADRWPGFDDGIYASARLCELLSKDDRSIRQVFDDLPEMIGTPEIRVKYSNAENLVENFKSKVDFLDAQMNYMDGVRVDFNHGFGLLRSSNTAPELVFRFESESADGLDQIIQSFKDELRVLDHGFHLPI